MDGITLEIDVGTDLGYQGGSCDGYNDGNLDNFFIGDSLGSTDGKVCGYDKRIKLRSLDGRFLGNILGNVYIITLGLVVGTNMVYLDGSFDGSDDGKLEVLFKIYSLGFTDNKIPGYNEGIKLGLSYGKLLANILGKVFGITLGIYVGT